MNEREKLECELRELRERNRKIRRYHEERKEISRLKKAVKREKYKPITKRIGRFRKGLGRIGETIKREGKEAQNNPVMGHFGNLYKNWYGK